MVRSHLGRRWPHEGAHDPASSHLASGRASELCWARSGTGGCSVTPGGRPARRAAFGDRWM